MYQALIPTVTPACQFRNDFCNAFGFLKIPSYHKAAAEPNSLLTMDTWLLAQAEADLEILTFIEITPAF